MYIIVSETAIACYYKTEEEVLVDDKWVKTVLALS